MFCVLSMLLTFAKKDEQCCVEDNCLKSKWQLGTTEQEVVFLSNMQCEIRREYSGSFHWEKDQNV